MGDSHDADVVVLAKALGGLWNVFVGPFADGLGPRKAEESAVFGAIAKQPKSI
jgi:hypothetical protein